MLPVRQLPNFQTTSAGKENLCFLTEGLNVGCVVLELGDDNGLPITDLVDDLRFYLFDEAQWNFKAFHWQQMLSIRGPKFGFQTSGVPGTAAYRTYVPFWFDQPWLEPKSAGNALGLNLVPGCTPKIGVEIKSGVNNPVIQGWYRYRSLNGGLGAITKYKIAPVQVSSTKNNHVNLEKKDLIQSIHMFPPDNGGYVNEVSFTRNSQTIFDQVTHLQNQVNLIGRGLNPDTTATPRFDLFFDDEDPQDLGLAANGLTEMTLTTKYSQVVTGTMDILMETIGAPDRS